MDKLLSQSFQKKLLLIYFASFISAFCLFKIFTYYGFFYDSVVKTYNLLGEIDPAGTLVFAGVAAGLIFTSDKLLFYKNVVFMFGFVFAFSQAFLDALGPIVRLSGNATFAVFLVLITGVGFTVFSFIAMAAYEHEKRMERKDSLKPGQEENGSNTNHVSPNPSSKNDSAQPSPALSDLAHDLRYSRSRARRSRAQR